MAVLLVSAAVPALAGCESTQSKNLRAERQAGAQVKAEAGLAVTTPSADITPRATTLVTDPEIGSAVVVELENSGRQDAFEVPVLVRVAGSGGDELFSNGVPGLGRSLTHAAVVPAGETTVWVNDQVPVTAGAESATAVVGEPEGRAPDPAVEFSATQPKLVEDPTSGIAASGFVKHDSAEDLRRVVVTVVARRGDRVVAAGRGVVARIKAGKRAGYQAFMVGDPRGAELTATIQPNIDAE